MRTLKILRVDKMMTVRALASASGVSPTTLVKLEHGRVRPHYSTMLAIAGALGVHPREIAEFDAALNRKIAEAA